MDQIAQLVQIAQNLTAAVKRKDDEIKHISNKLDATLFLQTFFFGLFLNGQKLAKSDIAMALQTVLDSKEAARNPYLIDMAQYYIKSCQEDQNPEENTKSAPEWFQGIVTGGRSDDPDTST